MIEKFMASLPEYFPPCLPDKDPIILIIEESSFLSLFPIYIVEDDRGTLPLLKFYFIFSIGSFNDPNWDLSFNMIEEFLPSAEFLVTGPCHC